MGRTEQSPVDDAPPAEPNALGGSECNKRVVEAGKEKSQNCGDPGNFLKHANSASHLDDYYCKYSLHAEYLRLKLDKFITKTEFLEGNLTIKELVFKLLCCQISGLCREMSDNIFKRTQIIDGDYFVLCVKRFRESFVRNLDKYKVVSEDVRNAILYFLKVSCNLFLLASFSDELRRTYDTFTLHFEKVTKSPLKVTLKHHLKMTSGKKKSDSRNSSVIKEFEKYIMELDSFRNLLNNITQGGVSRAGNARRVETPLRLLHQGSRSSLYLGFDVETRKEVLFKVTKTGWRTLKSVIHGCPEDNERKFLYGLNFPLIISLYWSQNFTNYLYVSFVEFASYGDVRIAFSTGHPVDKDIVRKSIQHITAEMVLAVEYLHSSGVIHGNITPKTVLISGDDHIRLTGFEFATISTFADNSYDERHNPFALGWGDCFKDASFSAPEMSTSSVFSKAVDYWSIGAVHSFMRDQIEGLNSHCVQTCQTTSPSNLASENNDGRPNSELQASESEHENQLVLGLLETNHKFRLGYHGSFEVKQAKYFVGLDWEHLLSRDYRVITAFMKTRFFNEAHQIGSSSSLKNDWLKYNSITNTYQELPPDLKVSSLPWRSALHGSETTLRSKKILESLFDDMKRPYPHILLKRKRAKTFTGKQETGEKCLLALLAINFLRALIALVRKTINITYKDWLTRLYTKCGFFGEDEMVSRWLLNEFKMHQFRIQRKKVVLNKFDVKPDFGFRLLTIQVTSPKPQSQELPTFYHMVEKVFDGSVAKLCGLTAGRAITQVNGKDTCHLNQSELVHVMAGSKGCYITLTVEILGEPTPRLAAKTS